MVRSDRGSLIRRLGQVSLLPAAAFAVHQLRYLLAFGGNAGAELQRQGHSYLHSLVPWIVLLVALGVGGFLRALGRAFAGQNSRSRFTASFAGLWLASAICLVAIYVGQEFLEGLFATGHPGGWVGIFGYGGWWSIPAALCVGLVLAAVFHGARWALDELSQRRSPVTVGSASRAAAPRPREVLLPRLSPLAEGCSGRGPPR